MDGFGGAGHTRESPTKVPRPENHDHLKESHGESKIAALHTWNTYYVCTAVWYQAFQTYEKGIVKVLLSWRTVSALTIVRSKQNWVNNPFAEFLLFLWIICTAAFDFLEDICYSKQFNATQKYFWSYRFVLSIWCMWLDLCWLFYQLHHTILSLFLSGMSIILQIAYLLGIQCFWIHNLYSMSIL